MERLAIAIATAFGVGYVPVAPGTFGSAAGLVVWWALPPSPVVQSIASIALFAVGTWSAHVAERHFNNTDPGPVVIDEVMGMLITLIGSPLTLTAAVAGFLLFRLFDIIKPYPANRLENLHGGVGIMADDAMAAVYANIALRVVNLAGGAIFGVALL
jgi:phosphatidylglycerophosphatase A